MKTSLDLDFSLSWSLIFVLLELCKKSMALSVLCLVSTPTPDYWNRQRQETYGWSIYLVWELNVTAHRSVSRIVSTCLWRPTLKAQVGRLKQAITRNKQWYKNDHNIFKILTNRPVFEIYQIRAYILLTLNYSKAIQMGFNNYSSNTILLTHNLESEKYSTFSDPFHQILEIALYMHFILYFKKRRMKTHRKGTKANTIQWNLWLKQNIWYSKLFSLVPMNQFDLFCIVYWQLITKYLI